MRMPCSAAVPCLLLAGLCATGALFAETGKAQPREGFLSDAGIYSSTASGQGPTEAEAVSSARSAALHGLFVGLGKDRLFAEVFAASPPLGLGFELVQTAKEGNRYRAFVQLKVDDESVRIVERGPYLAAAIAILDKAEAASDEAEAHRADAAAAETRAELGSALGLYGMAADGCRSALELVDPVGDPSVFSSARKRTSPELKKGLAAILADASSGIERVKKAESALAADASSEAARAVADSALAAADQAQALLDESAPILNELGSYDADRLEGLRDRLALERRSLSDSKAALERARAALPPGEGSFASDNIDFASHRLASADASLAIAHKRVDREIRDPAARRAARARAFRWAFFHEPREYLSLRAYLPLDFFPGESAAYTPLEARMSLEGAFAFGSGGVWVRSQASIADMDLKPGEEGGDEFAFTQSFDFGVWGKSLVFAGYSWDWLRIVDSEDYPRDGAVRLGIGGVYDHSSAEGRFQRADWLLALSYELPYRMDDFETWDLFNLGVEAQFRLGSIALLEAQAAKRLYRVSDEDYSSLFRWTVGLAFRFPKPFAYGIEYGGTYVQPLRDDGSLGEAYTFEGGRFRIFLQYSI